MWSLEFLSRESREHHQSPRGSRAGRRLLGRANQDGDGAGYSEDCHPAVQEGGSHSHLISFHAVVCSGGARTWNRRGQSQKKRGALLA